MAQSSKTNEGLSPQPKKWLGQHFLSDNQIIQKILAFAQLKPIDPVLEIGPGQGALTLPLARSVSRVVAVEKDPDLIGLLKKDLFRQGIPNVTLVNQDILKWDFRDMIVHPQTKIKVVGNLPYNISSPFLEKLMENRNVVGRAILMFQLEFAQRLTALPGGKSYGALTLLVRYHAHPTVLFKVPKDAFYPKPKVDSMVIELDFRRPFPRRAVNEDVFKKLVKGAFAHRRKTLINSLDISCPSWNREVLLEGMGRCGIDPARRAETLDMDEFICLTSVLKIDKNMNA